MLDAVIIGAGISGLACGYSLRAEGKSVLVLEASNSVGGLIRTEEHSGYRLEFGPNSLRGDSPELESLITNLGLKDRIVTPSLPRFKSYIARGSSIVAIPRSPLELFTTDILSIGEKIALFREFFSRKSDRNSDESVASFFRRRIGSGAVETLVKPMVSGIFAGDAERLSMKSAFEKFWAYEQEYGSVVRGVIKNRKKQKPQLPRMFTFKGGLNTFSRAILDKLNDSLILSTTVVSVTKSNGFWTTKTADGKTFESKSVIITTPLPTAKKLLDSVGGIATIGEVYYPPVTVVQLGFDRNAISHPLDGFGFLVPPKEHSDILGCIFTSSLFNDRAPRDKTLLTVMLGGTTNPAITALPQDEVITKAVKTVSGYLDITSAPEFARLFSWQAAIPQYHIGHEKVITHIEQIESENRGLHLIGNYRGGISIGSCVSQAMSTAAQIIRTGQ